jgi:hypothetical protein
MIRRGPMESVIIGKRRSPEAENEGDEHKLLPENEVTRAWRSQVMTDRASSESC